MRQSFGPWATGMESGPQTRLSTFWRRRLAMLAAVSRCKQPLGRSAAAGLIAAGLAIVALPTFRASQAAAPQDPPGGTTAAGESPAAGAANPSTAPDNAANSTATVEELIEQLFDRDPAVRGEAAETLGKLGPAAARAVPALIESLIDYGTWDVLVRGKEETDSQGVIRRNSPWRQGRSVYSTASDALVAIGSPAVEPLLKVAHDPQSDGRMRNMVGVVLARIGDPRAATFLVHQSDRNRDAVSQVGEPDAVFNAPGDPAPALAVVDLLRERLKDAQRATILPHTLNDSDRQPVTSGFPMREDAREALTGVLREHLGDTSPMVRATAADLLGTFGAEGSERLRKELGESLREHAGDESPAVRLAVAFAQADLGVTVDNLDALLDAATSKNTPADPKWRLRALNGLGKTRDPRALPVLIDALKDPTSEVKTAAAWYLGETKAREAVDALLIALEDSDENVSKNARHALGQIADPLTIPRLLEIADTSDNTELRILAGSLARYIAHPKAEFSQIAWGEPVGDLRLGLRWHIAGDPVRIGEVVECYWVIRNQGIRDWSIRMTPPSRARRVDGRDIDLGAAERRTDYSSRIGDSGWIVVRAGTMVEITSNTYSFRPEDGGKGDLPLALNLPVTPGRYQVHASFVGTVRGDATAEESTRVTLSSGTLELEVADDNQGNQGAGTGPPR